VDLQHAAGRFAAERIVAAGSLPPCALAAEDGFLVEEGAATGAYDVVGLAVPGGPKPKVPAPGQCLRIECGAPVPVGSKIVPTANAKLIGTNRVHLVVERNGRTVPEGFHLSEGATVVEAGHRITARSVAILRALRINTVEVIDPPTVHVLAVDTQVASGEIPEATAAFLCAFIKERGIPALYIGAVPDDTETVRREVSTCLPGGLLIVCGGAGHGLTDKTLFALRTERVRIVCEGVALQPGGTTAIAAGRRGVCLLMTGEFCGAVAAAYALLPPTLSRWLGVRLEDWTCSRAVPLAKPWEGPSDRFFVFAGRVKDGRCVLEPERSLLAAERLFGLPGGRAVRRAAVPLAGGALTSGGLSV